jgi:hypothetical protein
MSTVPASASTSAAGAGAGAESGAVSPILSTVYGGPGQRWHLVRTARGIECRKGSFLPLVNYDVYVTVTPAGARKTHYEFHDNGNYSSMAISAVTAAGLVMPMCVLNTNFFGKVQGMRDGTATAIIHIADFETEDNGFGTIPNADRSLNFADRPAISLDDAITGFQAEMMHGGTPLCTESYEFELVPRSDGPEALLLTLDADQDPAQPWRLTGSYRGPAKVAAPSEMSAVVEEEQTQTQAQAQAAVEEEQAVPAQAAAQAAAQEKEKEQAVPAQAAAQEKEKEQAVPAQEKEKEQAQAQAAAARQIERAVDDDGGRPPAKVMRRGVLYSSGVFPASTRINNVCRSVIGPDPDIEVLISPRKTRSLLTRRVAVDDDNISDLRDCIRLATGQDGAALRVVLPDKSILDLTTCPHIVRNDVAQRLCTACEVVRPLKTGDPVVINRQPTLSQYSMLAQSAVVTQGPAAGDGGGGVPIHSAPGAATMWPRDSDCVQTTLGPPAHACASP